MMMMKAVENIRLDHLCRDVRNIPRHVALLFSGNTLLDLTTNSKIHAEEELIARFRRRHVRDTRRLKIFVTKLGGMHSYSRPCKFCSLLLKKFPQIRVFYTLHDGTWVEDKELDNEHVSMGDLSILGASSSPSKKSSVHTISCSSAKKSEFLDRAKR